MKYYSTFLFALGLGLAAADDGVCPIMKENWKCKWGGGGDRVVQNTRVDSLEACHKLCEEAEGCKFFAFTESYQGHAHCMGCKETLQADNQHGYDVYPMECAGVAAEPAAAAEPAEPAAAAQPATEFVRYTGPKVCAKATGDPHMTTFDSHKYDCQGQGDFIMSKSLNTDFELQGRFERVPGLSVTTTQGVVLNTGYANEPEVEISYTKTCDLTYTLDGSKVDLEGTTAPESIHYQFYAKDNFRSFMFPSGVEMKVELRKWRGDCLLSTYLCIPEALASENIVGILGSPDSDQNNDFMMRDGTPYNPKPDSRQKKNAYCIATWCVPTVEENLFAEPGALCGEEMKFFPKSDIFNKVKDEMKCGTMSTNEKCAYRAAGHPDRLFRLEEQTEETCREACLEDPDCKFYSFGTSSSSHPNVCMGCTTATTRDPHAGFEIFALECDGNEAPELDDIVGEADPEIVAACEENEACIIDAVLTGGTTEENVEEGLRTLEEEKADPSPPSEEEIKAFPAPPKVDPKNPGGEDPADVQSRSAGGDDKTKTKASGSGDPHFKTWTGTKYDYHGECDLVLLDHPAFNNGQGLRVHIRTTRIKYFSFISTIAVQIGEDTLEFENDAENFLLNGVQPPPNVEHQKTHLGGFVVNRGKKALSIRLHDEGSVARQNGEVVKIDLHTRKNGFPAVIVDGGKSDMFRGSLGLLGDWETGRFLGRDGETDIEVDPEDGSAFALEWQVRDTEPMLFSTVRAPQYPATCIPPEKIAGGRLGMERAKLEAAEACGHWEEDMEDCIFDVIATRDVNVALEGHIVHVA